MPKHQTVKQRKKELANRMAKQHQQKIIMDSREPKELIDKIAEVVNVEVVEPVSPARRAYQNL